MSRQGLPSITMHFRDAYVDEQRVKIGLHPYHAAGIQSLHINTYYT